ncbi:MAG: glutamate--tRNA ligase, partial [Chloroflexi bacterium]|nr:glutamate--tRNA ligase [Chloroflexota bacterium]
HLANVVDDHLMEVTHILRADEWLASVPLHMVLYQAFGWQPPVFAHLPVILDPSGHGKMSKRKTVGPGGQNYPVMVHEFIEGGYLPEAMFNFLALLGWSYDDHTELMTRAELIERFSLERVRPAPSAFTYSKLDWMNGAYIRQLAPEDLCERLVPFLAPRLGLSPQETRARQEVWGLAPLVQERIKTLTEAYDLVDFLFAEGPLTYDPALLDAKTPPARALQALEAAAKILGQYESFEDEAAIEAQLRQAAEESGLKVGAFFGAIRLAVTGKRVSPPLLGSLAVLGRARTLQRLTDAQAWLRALAARA